MSKPILASALLCLGAFASISLLVATAEGGEIAGRIDASILASFRDETGAPIGPAWFQEAIRDVSALGSMTVAIGSTALVAAVAFARGRLRDAAFLIAAVSGAIILSSLAKWGFGRPRPDLFEHATRVFTPSFPSAHATVSAAVAGAFGALAIAATPEPRGRAAALAGCAAVILSIGVSRIYLGVHWPSDVAAGWTLGLAWVLACACVMGVATRRSGGA